MPASGHTGIAHRSAPLPHIPRTRINPADCLRGDTSPMNSPLLSARLRTASIATGPAPAGPAPTGHAPTGPAPTGPMMFAPGLPVSFVPASVVSAAFVSALCTLLLVCGMASVSAQTTDPAVSCFLIGNSLTWDTVPPQLDGDVQWHVDCGVSLQHIFANPQQPCVNNSTLWPTALRSKQYKFVVVQPHYGSTLAADVETISEWMQLQPNAVFVIHTGWAYQDRNAEEFASYTVPEQMVHSPGYIRALLSELQRKHPQRQFRQTFAQNLLAAINEDIAAERAPLDNLGTLYRDAIHLTLDHGRYLAHNAMRHSLGQPRSAAGFPQQQPSLRAYLDEMLALLDTTAPDRALLQQILQSGQADDRAALAANISSAPLQARVTALLPQLDQAAMRRQTSLAVAAAVEQAGGRVVWTPSGPQWLYLATGDTGVDLFDVVTTVDLYNGNNPLKGKGGRNDQVTDDWLQQLSTLDTARRLDLSNCAIQGPGLQHIAGLTGLRELNLTLTPVTDAGLAHLSGLLELRKLGLASTQCTGTGFAHLKALQRLEEVNFHFTPLNDDGLRAITAVPISVRLWFAHTHFTDDGAASLAQLQTLRLCGIGSSEEGSSGAAVAALTKLPLEDLSLLDRQATPVGIEHAAKIHTLKRLDVSYAPTVTDESLRLVAGLPQLEEFRLGSAQVTDAGLQHLAACKSLRRLYLSGLPRISEDGISELQTACPELTIDVR